MLARSAQRCSAVLPYGAVEVAFGKVDQRLATLERLHLPSPDAGE